MKATSLLSCLVLSWTTQATSPLEEAAHRKQNHQKKREVGEFGLILTTVYFRRRLLTENVPNFASRSL